MKRNRNLIIGVILTAAAIFVALQNANDSTVDGNPGLRASTITPAFPITSTPTYENCGYMWAYHDYPELTEKVNLGVHDLNPDASVHAELFGEDCVYADGRSTFGAMETDFYLELPVESLSDEETLGKWVEQFMLVITQIPEDEIQGNYGFVEFSFIKNVTERITVRVSIQKYIQEANGRSGAELFRFFYTPPIHPT
ncbi:MAG: hypothetical protein K8S20_17095 [Chloroflexi bacterium]|nr:hypothetical protein [Chloroflexota bacterium]